MNLTKRFSVLIIISFSFISGCQLYQEINTEIEKERERRNTPPPTTIYENFESGNIGQVTKFNDTKWYIYLADDNNNSALPNSYRNWWYIKMKDVVTDNITEITLKNRGWPYYYIPVYSYNQEEWFRFSDTEVNQNSLDDLIMRKQFDEDEVWIARFYPYTLTDLENYLDTIIDNPYIEIETPGYSQNGRPIYLLKITNFGKNDPGKKRTLIHARTHPAETPPSFVLEGFIDFLISGAPEAMELLDNTEVYIFPMQNVDGVVVGNYRTTPQSENLEVMWYYDPVNPVELTSSAPAEVKVIHNLAKALMTDGGEPVTIALNLHATNSEPNTRPFFFPHFGPAHLGYSTKEAALWDSQMAFIANLAAHYGPNLMEPVPSSGGSSFATKKYPESWWWKNYKEEVMAITMEMTYGRSGYAPRWVEPKDLRNLGAALVLGIRDYYNGNYPTQLLKQKDWAMLKAGLKYPHLYPPNAVDERKE